MKRLTLFVLLTAMVLAATPSAAANGSPCDPTGTWWGHNKTLGEPFLITVAPTAAGHYSIVADGGANVSAHWQRITSWRGELTRKGNRTYEMKQILYGSPSILGTKPPFPDVAGAAGTLTLKSGCNKMKLTLDVAGAWAWGTHPFVDPPAVDILQGDVLHATYYRMR